MKNKFLIGILVSLPILFNLYFLKSELSIVSDVNDNVFAYALALRMEQAWDEGGCPLHLFQCLPRLTDHWVSYWAMGYPLPHYYQHLPSIINVALFKLLNSLGIVPDTTTALEANLYKGDTLQSKMSPLSSSPRQGVALSDKATPWPNANNYQNPGLFTVFNWTKYLLLCFYPLAIFWSARKFRFSPLSAAFCAVLSTLISTNFQYGTDYGSLIWRGSGMHTQLWGIFFLPLSLASIYETLTTIKHQQTTSNQYIRPSDKNKNDIQSISYSINKLIHIPYLLRSILLLTLTFHSHVLYGYIASLSAIVLILSLLIRQLIEKKLIKNEEMSKTKTKKIKNNQFFSTVLELALYIFKLIKKPVIILFIIYGFTFTLIAYWVIPLFVNDAYHAKSVWDELYKFDSFGAREVVNRYFAGEIFDYGRFPVFTILVFVGFFYALNKFFEIYKGVSLLSKVTPFQNALEVACNGYNKQFSNETIKQCNNLLRNATPFSKNENNFGKFDNLNFIRNSDLEIKTSPLSYLLFPLLLIFWTLLYFGRTTWGSLIDLLPGSEGIHMHRFINGVHFAGIFLGGLGLYWIFQKVYLFLNFSKNFLTFILHLPDPESLNNSQSQNLNLNIKQYLKTSKIGLNSNNLLLVISCLLFVGFILFPAISERVAFLNHNTFLINHYNAEYKRDFQDFIKVMAEIKKRQSLKPGRIWAGRPGNWGRQFKVGGAESYLTLSVNGFDTLGFEPESWSPNTDLEQFFNDQRLDHYNLFNIRYILAPPELKFPEFAKKINTYGKYTLYTVETNGNFDFVNSNLKIYGDKYNTLNFNRFWLDSLWPEYKSHPQILYSSPTDKTFDNFQALKIVDWTSYKWLPHREKETLPLSLLANNPFFSTPSALLNNMENTTAALAKQRLPLSNSSVLQNEIVKNDYYSIELEATQPSLLLLKATFHPFWKATLTPQATNHIQQTTNQNILPIKNQKLETAIAMYSPYFMGIEVPEGKYKVEFTYFPKPYKLILLIISLITLLLIFSASLIRTKKFSK